MISALRSIRRLAVLPRQVAAYSVASSSSAKEGVEGFGEMIKSFGGGASGGGDDDEPSHTPIPGGEYDGVKLEPYERLKLNRHGEEVLEYVGKKDPRPLKELDFAELLSGKYQNVKFTEDQVYANIFDTVAGLKLGKAEVPDFEKRFKQEMKKLDPDTFGKFGLEHNKELALDPPSKREVFKLDKNRRPLSSAFFTTSPVYYEEIGRLKQVLKKLDELAAGLRESPDVAQPAGRGPSGDAQAHAIAANHEDEAQTGRGSTTETEDAVTETLSRDDGATSESAKRRPVIPGENRVLDWDDKMKLITMFDENAHRKHAPWEDDDGVNFFFKEEGGKQNEMTWHTEVELCRALGSPLSKTQYRRLLRYARQIEAHSMFDEDNDRSLMAYRKPKPVVDDKKGSRRPLDSLGQAYATGRKKCASAVAYLKPGTGEIRINRRNITEFCGTRLTARQEILSPFMVTNTLGDFDVDVVVRGGGQQGKVIACRHGISKAIENYWFNTKSEEEGIAMRRLLKAHRLIQRDPRVHERRKAGQHGARTKKRWTKR